MKKICQACHTVNDMEATQCIGCGRKFIDPKKIKRKRVVKYSLLGALGLFILLYFGVFLLGSNAHKPSDPILRYFSLLEEEKYEEAMACFDFPQDSLEFNGQDAFEAYCREQYGDDLRVTSVKRTKVKDEPEDVRTYTVELAGGYSGRFSVHRDGKDLLIYDRWRMDAPSRMFDKTLTVYAADGISVELDGVVLGEQYLTGEKTIPGYDGMDDQSAAPTLRAYEVTGLLRIPTASAAGGSCTVTMQDGVSVFTRPVDDAQREQYETVVFTAAKTYANFISDDTPRYRINQMLIPDSELYRNVADFYNGWYTPHTGAFMEDVSYYDLAVYSDDAFSCGIRFTYHITGIQDRVREQFFPTDYKLYFVRQDGQWKLAGMQTPTAEAKAES